MTETYFVPANANHVFWQGSTPGLGDNCHGSAVIRALDGRVLAIVNDSYDTARAANVEAAAYNALRPSLVGRIVNAPLFRSGHPPSRLFTGVSARNAGTSTAAITITARPAGSAGAVATKELTVQPNQTAVFWPSTFANAGLWTDERTAYGFVTLGSTQPLAVIASDSAQTTDLSQRTDQSTYLGIPYS